MKLLRAASLVVLVVGCVLVCVPGDARPGTPAAPVALATSEYGSGPTIVIVHNLGSGRLTWMPVARKLIGKYHVVLVDLPGHGESPMPDPFTFEAAANALDAILAQQKGDSTIVVGHGLGGTLAIMALARHPEHARGIVAVDANLRWPNPVPDAQRKAFMSWFDDNFDSFLKLVYSETGRDSTQSAELLAQASLVPRANLRQYYVNLFDLDATRSLKDLKRPVLYVASELAWPAGKPWSAVARERGFEQAAGVDTVRIPGSAQLIARDQPDAVASAIAAFAVRTLASAN